MYDPANRPDSRDNTTTDMLTERGHLQILGNVFNFPKMIDNKHFSGEFYVTKVINTDCVQCNMLIYSTKVNVIFSFCCKLYGTQTASKLVKEGTTDWKYLSEKLRPYKISKWANFNPFMTGQVCMSHLQPYFTSLLGCQGPTSLPCCKLPNKINLVIKVLNSTKWTEIMSTMSKWTTDKCIFVGGEDWLVPWHI